MSEIEGVAVIADFLNETDERCLVNLARATLYAQEKTGTLDERIIGPHTRRTARFGYGLGGMWRGPLPGWIDVLRTLAERAIMAKGIDENFDSAAIYDYASGSERGAHFDERHYVGAVALISAGSSAVGTLCDADGQRKRSFVVPRRSLYVLHGDGFSKAMHAVECPEPRIAVAFRRCARDRRIGGPPGEL